ncbi:hypothetical protein NSK_008473 [Nannochloropsis salina CCMP1776]|uniref:Uncharacterized protein n=1 Tax=Nannochloropsis salina CCMP1776 TaxID=1027361 RepID=A0A4D9CQ54_9STRA|nr:hypothetical protein NSK_008473 [Nannochloropsis salina CCMP1776]|eukprot:TFJ80187.1 hypothetical protein NSK_008473 [Nannochloropsis salina CCMP1776]
MKSSPSQKQKGRGLEDATVDALLAFLDLDAQFQKVLRAFVRLVPRIALLAEQAVASVEVEGEGEGEEEGDGEGNQDGCTSMHDPTSLPACVASRCWVQAVEECERLGGYLSPLLLAQREVTIGLEGVLNGVGREGGVGARAAQAIAGMLCREGRRREEVIAKTITFLPRLLWEGGGEEGEGGREDGREWLGKVEASWSLAGRESMVDVALVMDLLASSFVVKGITGKRQAVVGQLMALLDAE